MYDVTGIGALNLDYIVTKSQFHELDNSKKQIFLDKFEKGKEIPATESEIDEILQKTGLSIYQKLLGGSAFNTIHALVKMKHDLKLGYIGVAGNTGFKNLNYYKWFKKNEINHKLVKNEKELKSGRCISYTDEAGVKSLLTSPGVNIEMAEFLSGNFDEILDYITQSRIIHVTSFFDNETIYKLLDILQNAKEETPSMLLSFDPGYQWIESKLQQVKRIFKFSDFLFLNDDEFKKLSNYSIKDSNCTIIGKVLDMCNTETLLILKHSEVIKISWRENNKIRLKEYKASDQQNGIRDTIEDMTGIGDVLAGGMLIGELTPSMKIENAVELALRLCKQKLLSAGTKSFNSFGSIYRDYLAEKSL